MLLYLIQTIIFVNDEDSFRIIVWKFQLTSVTSNKAAMTSRKNTNVINFVSHFGILIIFSSLFFFSVVCHWVSAVNPINRELELQSTLDLTAC